MTSQALQTAGFVTGAVGTVGVLAATIMDVWCTDHSENDPASNSHYRGLWKDCEVAESGLAECQSFNSHLSFTRILQAVRALMVLAIILGVIAVVIGCFCLNCINVRSMNTTARSKLVLAAGILFIIAGVFDISGSSVYADQLVPSFMVRSPARSTHKSEETGAILCQNGMGMGQITSQDTGKGTGPGHFQVHGQVHGQVYGQGQGQGQVYGQGQGQGQGQVYGQGQGQGMGMGMGSGTGNGMGTGMGTDMGTDMGTGMGTEMGTGMGFDGTESRATRYTFGAALYIAWVAGVLLILAGILKCISFKTMQLIGDTREAYIYNATAQCRGAEEENRLQRIRGDQQQQI
ncbi:Claudin-18 [Labeo rohita]|uniref:Claudin-18 n=1 Tax=Labeo rohita TaxID=84645 RepID=A0ABQ8MXD3_LABRO|nr:Claudin-18 [Labeo rohita]